MKRNRGFESDVNLIFGRRVRSYRRAQKKHEAKIIISSKVTFLIRCFVIPQKETRCGSQPPDHYGNTFSVSLAHGRLLHNNTSVSPLLGRHKKQQLRRRRPASSAGLQRLQRNLQTSRFAEETRHRRERDGSPPSNRVLPTFSGWMSERWRAVPIRYLPTGSWRKNLLTMASRRQAA